MYESRRDAEYEAAHQPQTRWWRVLFALLLVGWACMGCCSVPESYLKADRAALDTIGRDFAEYVRNDATLPPALAGMKLAAVEAWRVRVEEAEKEAAGE